MISPNPKNSQDINPKIFYKTIDDNGKAIMILSNIFEVKKNIMGDTNGGFSDPDYIDPVSNHINENFKYNESERFYTKIKSFEDAR